MGTDARPTPPDRPSRGDPPAAGGPAPRPLLCIDVDGVLSLFSEPGSPAPIRPDTQPLNVEGIIHLIALDNCRRIASLQDSFELIWATGWEDKANDDLLRLVGLGEPLDVIRFETRKYDHQAHWKLAAIEVRADGRALAWIDDALDDACREWAASRPAPTLLVETDTHVGVTDSDVETLRAWASSIDR